MFGKSPGKREDIRHLLAYLEALCKKKVKASRHLKCEAVPFYTDPLGKKAEDIQTRCFKEISTLIICCLNYTEQGMTPRKPDCKIKTKD